MRKYKGLPGISSGVVKVFLDIDDRHVSIDLPLSRRGRDHSPDGFAWGYLGSGPSALAHSLLLDVFYEVEKMDKGRAINRADGIYHHFKERVVAYLPIGEAWILTSQMIQDHVAAIESEIDAR